ncbi:hypothetical protein B0H19DRAFT_1384364 [Mycena capillaripes]|nr:hypothetical protein B0H19DRAFT_1384364 [Mycena capillaripes]
MKCMMSGAAYNSRGTSYSRPLFNTGWTQWFAAHHPDIVFTHIYPVHLRRNSSTRDVHRRVSPPCYPADEYTKYMLYALLGAERGIFIRDNHGDVLSSHVFPPHHQPRIADDCEMARRVDFLNGVQMKACGGSDVTVAGLFD